MPPNRDRTGTRGRRYQSRSPTAKFERRWPKLQRIARSLCALSSPSASSDRTRAGRARSHPPPAGLSPPARPPARPTNFDEASERFDRNGRRFAASKCSTVPSITGAAGVGSCIEWGPGKRLGAPARAKMPRSNRLFRHRRSKMPTSTRRFAQHTAWVGLIQFASERLASPGSIVSVVEAWRVSEVRNSASVMPESAERASLEMAMAAKTARGSWGFCPALRSSSPG